MKKQDEGNAKGISACPKRARIALRTRLRLRQTVVIKTIVLLSQSCPILLPSPFILLVLNSRLLAPSVLFSHPQSIPAQSSKGLSVIGASGASRREWTAR